MCIFEIESIEHELEFAPKFFKLQKNTESRHTEKRLYQPKKKHYRHHPTIQKKFTKTTCRKNIEEKLIDIRCIHVPFKSCWLLLCKSI